MYAIVIDARTLAVIAVLCLALAFRARNPGLYRVLALIGWGIILWNTYRSWF